MAQCTGQIAASIGLNCEHPIVGGYTGRAILIPREELMKFPVVTEDPRMIQLTDTNPPTIPTGAKVYSVDNVEITNPFDGSASTGNEDDGFRKFTKTLAIRIPERGAAVSKNVIEPLLRTGKFVAIVEKKDMVGDGSFEVIGFYDNMRVVDPATVSRNESENGGSWNATLQCSEYYAECVLVAEDPTSPDYELTLGVFEALWNAAQNA